MKITELKAKTVDQLKELLVEHKKELFNLRFRKVTGELENVARIGQVRKIIARIKTLLREKLAGEANA